VIDTERFWPLGRRAAVLAIGMRPQGIIASAIEQLTNEARNRQDDPADTADGRNSCVYAATVCKRTLRRSALRPTNLLRPVVVTAELLRVLPLDVREREYEGSEEQLTHLTLSVRRTPRLHLREIRRRPRRTLPRHPRAASLSVLGNGTFVLHAHPAVQVAAGFASLPRQAGQSRQITGENFRVALAEELLRF
jgi:hypothetical protein